MSWVKIWPPDHTYSHRCDHTPPPEEYAEGDVIQCTGCGKRCGRMGHPGTNAAIWLQWPS